MSSSVDGRDSVEDQTTVEESQQTGAQRAAAGWYPDPFNEARQRYWDGESWTTEFRLIPLEFAPSDEAPVAVEVWPPQIDQAGSYLPAVIDTPADAELEGNSSGSRRWFSGKRFIIAILLIIALAAIGFLLNRQSDDLGTTDALPGASTIQATTTSVAPTTTEPTTSTPATTTSQTPTTTTTTTTQPTTTTQTSTTTEAPPALSPEEQFETWQASMAIAVEGGAPAEDGRVLTESNAAFLCSRALDEPTFESLVDFVREFFYDAAPQRWDPQPEMLDEYSTAYTNTSLEIYCPDVHAQLVQP